MYEKSIAFIIAFLSFLGALFSSKLLTYDDVALTATNYMDVSFVNVSSKNNSSVFINDNGKGIELRKLNLSNDKRKEVITYQIINNSYTYDVDMNILINGHSHYENDYYSISCSKLGKVNKGDIIEGVITIELKKDIYETLSIPFNIEVKANPIQKEYLF